MKTFKNFITEAKHVGTIYHYTTIEKLHDIIHQDKPFEMGSHNGETISATRNPQLSLHNKTFKNHNVRITLDGDKISEHHKVRPIAGLTDNEGDVENHKHNDKYRVKRDSGEAEEAIIKHPLNIHRYIKHIHIIKNRNDDHNVENNIIPKLKELNVPHSYTKSYSLTSLKEDWNDLTLNRNECFNISEIDE